MLLMQQRLLLLLLTLEQPATAAARSCLRVFYAGVGDDGACPAAKYEEVCSGWLAFDESCDDVMPPITPTGNWQGVLEAGRCATLLSSHDGHAVLCQEASNGPGRLLVALQWVSLVGWPVRAIAMMWSAAQQPAGDRAQDSLFPFSFTIMVLYGAVSCGWVGTLLHRAHPTVCHVNAPVSSSA